MAWREATRGSCTDELHVRAGPALTHASAPSSAFPPRGSREQRLQWVQGSQAALAAGVPGTSAPRTLTPGLAHRRVHFRIEMRAAGERTYQAGIIYGGFPPRGPLLS
ncbi:unnamed protein product [Caretta caretta]